MTEQNETIKKILTRASIREFTGEPITEEQLQILLKCAMAAPSAVNMQPWSFITVRDEELLLLISEKIPNAKMAKDAKTAIIVCGLPEKDEKFCKDYWIQDCSAASQNILLAAHAMGLGAVWTGVYPNQGKMDIVRELMAIPKNVIPLNIIPIGNPKTQVPPKDKFVEGNIHQNKW